MTLKRIPARSAAQSRRYSAKKQIGLASLLLITFFALFAGRANAFSQVVAFGDSLSDNGNIYAATGNLFPPAPYFNGRFSNGPVWVETLAGSLGVGLTDYAVGGATTGTVNTNNNVLGIGDTYDGMSQQFAAYLGGPVDTGALHTVFGGANDFLALGPMDNPITALGNAVTNLLTGIGGLLAAGVPGENILVLNLPNLGITPRSIEGDLVDPGSAAAATAITQAFNSTLAGQIAATFPGVGIIQLDVFALLDDILANPAPLGLTNITEPCFDADAMPTPPIPPWRPPYKIGGSNPPAETVVAIVQVANATTTALKRKDCTGHLLGLNL